MVVNSTHRPVPFFVPHQTLCSIVTGPAAFPTIAGLATLLALAGLGGCAAPQAPTATPPATAPPPIVAPSAADQQRRSEFDKALDSWHGATVQELLRKMGKPEAITRRADGTFDYRYSKSTRAGPDGRAAFSCTVRYGVDATGKRVIGHAIEGC